MKCISAALLSCLAFAFASTGPVFAQANDTLVIGLDTDINTLDPHMTASVGTDLSVASSLYQPLMIRAPDLKLHPAVATEWKPLDDTTWQIKLNPKAKWTNGEKMDSAAVKENFDRVMDPARKSRIATWFKDIVSIETPGSETVVIKTKVPFASLPDQLSMFMLLPPKWAANHNPAAEASSGGPYLLKSRVPGSSITLDVNPDYWGPKPPFAHVVYKVIPEAAARSAALVAGEIDFAVALPVTEVKRLDGKRGIEAKAIPSTRSAFLKFNVALPPMNNKMLRQALNYAVDKQAISDALFDGKAEVSSCQVMTSAYFGYNPDLKPYPYDPGKAAELIKKSGVDLSKPLEFDVPTNYLQVGEASQAIAEMLGAVGVKVNTQEMSFGTFMDRHVKARDLGAMSYLTYAWPTLDADGILGLSEPGSVYDYWNNAEFGEYLKEGRASTDQAKRLAAYQKATKLMCEEAPMLFLYNQPVTFAIRSNLIWHSRGDDWNRAVDFERK